MVYQKSKTFQIREWVEFDRKGRAPCPCCSKGPKDKTLSLVPKSQYGYKCFRGCTPTEIREALNAPLPGQPSPSFSTDDRSQKQQPPAPHKDYTVDEKFVASATERLLRDSSADAVAARKWLSDRHISKSDIERLNIGLGKRVVIPDENKPQNKETYGAICIFIPIPQQPGRYYVKKRVAPWLKLEQRPDYLGNWSQFGVPATVWFAHLPENARETWFCEGEWDAIRLAQLVREQPEGESPIAVACSTAGCGSVPKWEELQRLPGNVTIFYDRNDTPRKDGTRAGEEGAKKLAFALEGRGRIADVPMSEDCTVKGWDVSNAIDAGYGWADFHRSVTEAKFPIATEVQRSPACSEIDVRTVLLALLNRNPPPAVLTENLNRLSQESGWSVRELRQLAGDLQTDSDREVGRDECHQELKTLEGHKRHALDLRDYLPWKLAEPMQQVARWMGIPPSALLTVLLPAVASCLHPETRVVIKEGIDFVEPAIIYAGLVTESGQRKSPTLKAILQPLRELQAETDAEYKLAKAEYDGAWEQWQAAKDTYGSREEWKAAEPIEPVQKEFYVNKATSEAIDTIKSKQPDTAFLCIKDELSGLFGSYGAYKKGRGEDRESILSGWNGTGVKKNLKSGERISTLYESMSIIGAIQDSKLQKLMGNFDDDQGEWGRFLWVRIPLKALKLPDTDSPYQLNGLKTLYEQAREVEPQRYRFTAEAQSLYDLYHWNLEQRRVANSRQGMRAALSKMEGYTARLALVLHVIADLVSGRDRPDPYIPRERVEAAIGLAEFYLSQTTLIHSEGSAALNEGGLPHRLSAILDKLKQYGELTARRLQSSISWLRKEKPDDLRQNLIELARMGFGSLVGKGNRLKLVLNGETADRPVDRHVDREEKANPPNIEAFETPPRGHDDRVDRPGSLEENRHEWEMASSEFANRDEWETTSSEFDRQFDEDDDWPILDCNPSPESGCGSPEATRSTEQPIDTLPSNASEITPPLADPRSTLRSANGQFEGISEPEKPSQTTKPTAENSGNYGNSDFPHFEEPNTGDRSPVSAIHRETSNSSDRISEPTTNNQQPITNNQFDFTSAIAQINLELRRLGWTIERLREHLRSTYGKDKRQQLSDRELLDLTHWLRRQSPQPI